MYVIKFKGQFIKHVTYDGQGIYGCTYEQMQDLVKTQSGIVLNRSWTDDGNNPLTMVYSVGVPCEDYLILTTDLYKANIWKKQSIYDNLVQLFPTITQHEVEVVRQLVDEQ